MDLAFALRSASIGERERSSSSAASGRASCLSSGPGDVLLEVFMPAGFFPLPFSCSPDCDMVLSDELVRLCFSRTCPSPDQPSVPKLPRLISVIDGTCDAICPEAMQNPVGGFDSSNTLEARRMLLSVLDCPLLRVVPSAPTLEMGEDGL